MTSFEIMAHWSMVRRKTGVQSVQVYFVNERRAGTTMNHVKVALPYGVPAKVLREACNMAKDAYGAERTILSCENIESNAGWKTRYTTTQDGFED